MLQPLTLGPVNHGALPDWAPELARHSFHFAPPIVGGSPNQWVLRNVTSHEVKVVNAVTGQELTILRRFIDQVMGDSVTLTRRLEAVGARVIPADRGVIVMPAFASAPRVRKEQPATVIAIREATRQSPRWRKTLRMIVALGSLAAFAGAALSAFEDVPLPLLHVRPR